MIDGLAKMGKIKVLAYSLEIMGIIMMLFGSYIIVVVLGFLNKDFINLFLIHCPVLDNPIVLVLVGLFVFFAGYLIKQGGKELEEATAETPDKCGEEVEEEEIEEDREKCKICGGNLPHDADRLWYGVRGYCSMCCWVLATEERLKKLEDKEPAGDKK